MANADADLNADLNVTLNADQRAAVEQFVSYYNLFSRMIEEAKPIFEKFGETVRLSNATIHFAQVFGEFKDVILKYGAKYPKVAEAVATLADLSGLREDLQQATERANLEKLIEEFHEHFPEIPGENNFYAHFNLIPCTDETKNLKLCFNFKGVSSEVSWRSGEEGSVYVLRQLLSNMMVLDLVAGKKYLRDRKPIPLETRNKILGYLNLFASILPDKVISSWDEDFHKQIAAMEFGIKLGLARPISTHDCRITPQGQYLFAEIYRLHKKEGFEILNQYSYLIEYSERISKEMAK